MNNKRSFISALVASALCLAASTAQGQVTNPDFEIDPPPLSGWTVQGAVSRQANGTNHAALSLEAGSGGLSRIYQTVTIPPGTEWLSFRYRLFTGPTGDPSRPPDSFTAFLVDSDGDRLAVPPEADPTR